MLPGVSVCVRFYDDSSSFYFHFCCYQRRTFFARSQQPAPLAGIVTDASGAVVPGATVTIENPVSGLSRSAKTDASGHYQFTNLPLNPYHLTVVNATGFAPFTADVSVRSNVPVAPVIALQVGGASTTVTVSGGDLVENDSSLHTDLDRNMIEKLPLESSSSSVSSLVTLSYPRRIG